jgi:deazaflavin-dependent oxidoreductase (nitroreductase family)
MPLPRRLGRFNQRVTDPILWPIVSRLPGSRFGRIAHVGRRSGRAYRTPMLGFRDGDSIVFALTYGPGTQWVRNVLAAGACDFETRRGTRHLVDPRLFHDPERRSVPPIVRRVLGWLNSNDFLEMRITSSQGGSAMLSEHAVFPILLSTDLDASRSFYRDTLGLEILREDVDDRIVFRCGAGTQLVITRSTVGTSDTQTQMAWRVPDLAAAIADLRARGVHIEEYSAPDPVTVDGIADMGHSWAAWFIDPSRNVLAVVQPKG